MCETLEHVCFAMNFIVFGDGRPSSNYSWALRMCSLILFLMTQLVVVYGIDDDWCSLDKSQNHLFVNPSVWYSPDSSAFLFFFCFGESGGDRPLYTSKKGNTSADIIRPEKQISAPWPIFKKELSSVLRLEILRTVPVLSYPAWNINIKYKRHLSHKCCIWKVGFCYY